MKNLFSIFNTVFGKTADPDETRQHDITEGDEGIDDVEDVIVYDETL